MKPVARAELSTATVIAVAVRVPTAVVVEEAREEARAEAADLEAATQAVEVTQVDG